VYRHNDTPLYTTQNSSKLHQTMKTTVDDDKSDNNNIMIMMTDDTMAGTATRQ